MNLENTSVEIKPEAVNDDEVRALDGNLEISEITGEDIAQSKVAAQEYPDWQPLPIPLPDDNAQSEKTLENLPLETSEIDETKYLSLVFRDGLDMPISDMELYVTLPSGQVHTAKSTEQGAITVPVLSQSTEEIKIEVKDVAGKRQKVCDINLAQCKSVVIIRSPKVKVDLPLRPHQQHVPAVTKKSAPKKIEPIKSAPDKTTPAHVDTKSAWWNTNGAIHKAWIWLSDSLHLHEEVPTTTNRTPVTVKTLSHAGQPVTVVAGCECPNTDNLRLGRNNVYRQAILEASKRLGLIPQSLCALMDCEAGKVAEHIPLLGSDGKQLKNKKGKLRTATIHDLWNANAGNPQSGAAGLTQFLASTWLGHVLQPDLYIHTQSVANGWVRKDVDKKGKSHWVFVLEDGTTTAHPYAKRSSDGNVKKCLAMRMDPVWSINAAADYGSMNLQVLRSSGFKLAGLGDMDKAKLMYLLHHEGGGAGPLFIRNTLATAKGGTEGLRKKFAIQLGGHGAALAKAKIELADGDVEVAYRFWLASFVDDKFSAANKYFCSKPEPSNPATKVLVEIGGEPIVVPAKLKEKHDI